MAAHTVQQAADEAARAALPGLTDTERLSLATQAVSRVIASGAAVKPDLTTTTAASSAGYYKVTVTYRADEAAMAIGPVPLPTKVIARTAVIQLPSL